MGFASNLSISNDASAPLTLIVASAEIVTRTEFVTQYAPMKNSNKVKYVPIMAVSVHLISLFSMLSLTVVENVSKIQSTLTIRA
jgi:hypothetical protein